MKPVYLGLKKLRLCHCIYEEIASQPWDKAYREIRLRTQTQIWNNFAFEIWAVIFENKI